MGLTPERVADILHSTYAHQIPPIAALCEDWFELRKRAEEAEALLGLATRETLRLRSVWCDVHDDEPLEPQKCPCCSMVRIADLEKENALLRKQAEAAMVYGRKNFDTALGFQNRALLAEAKTDELVSQLAHAEAKLAGMKTEWRVTWTHPVTGENRATPPYDYEGAIGFKEACSQVTTAYGAVHLQSRESLITEWKDVEPTND